jgi:hypothetical protein
VSLFSSPKASAPADPPPPQYVDTRDEIGGTQSTYVTNPDGTKTLVTTRLPLTPEQQAYEDKLKSIADESLGWIEKLSTNYDRSQIPWLDQYLADYETTQVKGLDAAMADRTGQEERTLARYGQADSTAGNVARAQRGQDYTDSRGQINRDLSSIEQGVRENELGNASNLYSLATGRMDTQLGQLTQSLGRSQQFQLSDASLQQNRSLAIYGAQQNANAINAQNAGNKFNNLAALATLGAYALGGPMAGASAGAGFSAMGMR